MKLKRKTTPAGTAAAVTGAAWRVLAAVLLGTLFSVGGGLLWAVTPKDVLNDLHEYHRMEVRLGEIARRRGVSEAVRNFAEQLVRDHTQADQETLAVAAQEGFQLGPAEMGLMEKVTTEGLDLTATGEFDRLYAEEMAGHHKKMIEKLRAARKDLPDSSATAGFVDRLIPVLEKHLETSQKLSTN